MQHARILTVFALAGLCLAGDSIGALKLVGSVAETDFDVPTTAGAARVVTFSGVTEPVVGIGLRARYTTVQGDFKDGLGPWSLDVTMQATSPSSDVSSVFNPISGDVTIADYPLQDGSQVYGAPVAGNGMWTFDFGSTEPQSNWTYGLRNVSYYLFGEAPDVTWTGQATPVEGQDWNRPFFIEGISGQGPVRYHAMAFTVDVSGVYEFSSVLSSGNNHFSYIYRDAFVPADPLAHLLDYGLGNGFGHNGDPSGTSSFSAYLDGGSEYFFVTSQWAASSPIETADNMIVGPGTVSEVGICRADVNGDGFVDTADLGLLIAGFGSADPLTDVNNDGVTDTADLGILIGEFGQNCP